MGRQISLFSDFSQGENRVTNYCGLVLKLLYQESPAALENVLAELLDRPIPGLTVGPTFQQQVKQRNTIPDLAILQSSFAVFFETKLTDWYHLDQLQGHMAGFPEAAGIKILFLLSNFDAVDEWLYADERTQAEKAGIHLQPLSFSGYLTALRNNAPDAAFSEMLDEFEAYLDRESLLPRWKGLLDVVNCAGSMDEFDAGVYICPDTGGAYSHKRARYFGPYKQKAVTSICEIRAVVSVSSDLDAEVRYYNDVSESRVAYAAMAREYVVRFRSEEIQTRPLQVFILGPSHDTDFRKTSPGGMFGSKKYFHGVAAACDSAAELAASLNGQTWEGVSP